MWDLIKIYPTPYSIYLTGTLEFEGFSGKPGMKGSSVLGGSGHGLANPQGQILAGSDSRAVDP